MLFASDFSSLGDAVLIILACMLGIAIIGGFIVGIFRGVLAGIIAVPAIFLGEVAVAFAVSKLLVITGFRG